ncbi:MAG: serine protease, partial [Okeania sp. SIO2H7]|nr:serine protease [Okeania sp. SIO2H7]
FESEDFNIPESAAERNDPNFLHSQFSSAQSLNFFLGAIARTGINLAFNREAPRGFDNARTPLQSGSRSGTIDIFASEDAGAYEDPTDVVDDIYDIFEFGLQQQLRNRPNGVL